MSGCFIIAEAGVNHNGSLDLAKRLVDAALKAGADAVKFQTFRAERLVTRTAERASYQKKNVRGKESQYQMLKRLELSFDDFSRLKKYCDKKRIEFLSTPFDEESARFLVGELGMKRIKVPSGEIVNLPFLRSLASLQRPLIVSTGMSDLQEIRRAVEAVSKAPGLTLLHCTTNYPCPDEEVNLRAMLTLKETFRVPVGYSDHTMGIEVPVAAVALGASVIEKHFTLDRKMKGPDHRASLEPREFKAMVGAIRKVERALGSPEKRPTASEIEIRRVARRSLVAIKPLPVGAEITEGDLQALRAGDGLPPDAIGRIIGLRLKVAKKVGEPIRREDLYGS